MPQWRKLHTKTTESWTLNDMPDDFHRLLWLMLPLISCREGRGQASPSWIKGRAMTLRSDITADDVANAMDYYQQVGIINRYTVDGRHYYVITNWVKHQGNTSKEAESIYPTPTEDAINSYSGVSPELVQSNESTEWNGVEENGMDTKAQKNAPLPSQFQEMKDYWVELFPHKPKPRATNSSAPGKAKTRMSKPHFKKNWRDAMLRASKSNYLGLKETTWFDFMWFVENNDNYEKCLNGKYDFKPGTKHDPPPVNRTPRNYTNM